MYIISSTNTLTRISKTGGYTTSEHSLPLLYITRTAPLSTLAYLIVLSYHTFHEPTALLALLKSLFSSWVFLFLHYALEKYFMSPFLKTWLFLCKKKVSFIGEKFLNTFPLFDLHENEIFYSQLKEKCPICIVLLRIINYYKYLFSLPAI